MESREEPVTAIDPVPALDGAARAGPRRNLSEAVVERLLGYIAAGTAPERRLPVERALCVQLAVGRSTVREGLQTLMQLGVVETRGKGRFGSVVGARAELSRRAMAGRERRELIDHPLEARRMLEPAIAALAAERAADADIDEVARELVLMEQAAADARAIVAYDTAFHAGIARASGNPTLVFVIDALTAALADSRERSFRPGVGASVAIRGHHAILDALRARDAERASQAMLDHLADVERMIRMSLEEPEGG